jgi:ABC-type glycerol-3-phosphate transport system substrate-binding protein
MKSFTRILVLVLVGAMLLSTGAALAAPKQDKVKIVVWGEVPPQDIQPMITADFQDTFNKAHPNIELDYQFTDQEWIRPKPRFRVALARTL